MYRHSWLRAVRVRVDVFSPSFTHLGQTLSLPITLSDENLSHLVILATVAQASAFAMAEYFLLRKLRAKKRER